MRICSLGRIELPIGEALRIELESAEPGDEGVVHLQYYVYADPGAWALWLSCPRGELAGCEAAVQSILPEPTEAS
jgi:hypothetical protein